LDARGFYELLITHVTYFDPTNDLEDQLREFDVILAAPTRQQPIQGVDPTLDEKWSDSFYVGKRNLIVNVKTDRTLDTLGFGE
jgi:hypothetical protein